MRLRPPLPLVAILFACAPSITSAETQQIAILHDNDLHGHLRSFCYVELSRGSDERCGVGGAARRASLIVRLRAHSKAPTALVDVGDTSTRGPLATEYEGQDEIAAMNAIGYDLAALGNNEFKLKDGVDQADAAGAQAALQRLIAQSRFPWLCANVTDARGDFIKGVKPFVVRRMGRLRVAFLGLTTLKSVRYPQTKGLTFEDPVAAAARWVPKARAEADVVIAVTHLGVAGDQDLARRTRGIDAIVGGDSHTFLYAPLHERNLDDQPVPIVQDGEFGANLGDLQLTFQRRRDRSWALVRDRGRLIPIDRRTAAKPAVAAIVERYAAPLDAVVGAAPPPAADVARRKTQTAEILAAAWRSATGADIGLEPEDAPYEVFRTPQVTRYQVHAILPFHQNVSTLELTGVELKALLQAPPKPFLGALRVTIRPDQIEESKRYSIAMVDAAAQTLGLSGARDSGRETRASLEAYLSRP